MNKPYILYDFSRDEFNTITTKVNLNITKNTLDINTNFIYNDENINTSFNININELRNYNSFKPPCCYQFLMSGGHYSTFSLTNSLAQTMSTKENSTNTLKMLNSYAPLLMYVFSKDDDFENMIYFVNLMSKESTLNTNISNVIENGYSLLTSHRPLRMSPLQLIDITGPDIILPDEKLTYQINVTIPDFPYNQDVKLPYNKPTNVYLECNYGYLPKRNIIVNGTNEFSLRALDLVPGDIIKIKANFKYSSFIMKKVVTVV